MKKLIYSKNNKTAKIIYSENLKKYNVICYKDGVVQTYNIFKLFKSSLSNTLAIAQKKARIFINS